MPTQLGGYEDNLASKGSGLRDITTTSDGNKVRLDVFSYYENFDLINNPAHSWVITRGDGQPDSESITLANAKVYKRTFTYNGDGLMTARSAWVLQ